MAKSIHWFSDFATHYQTRLSCLKLKPPQLIHTFMVGLTRRWKVQTSITFPIQTVVVDPNNKNEICMHDHGAQQDALQTSPRLLKEPYRRHKNRALKKRTSGRFVDLLTILVVAVSGKRWQLLML